MLFLSIHSDQSILTIQLTDIIDLNTPIRLQIHILYNEMQIKINNGNIISSIYNKNLR